MIKGLPEKMKELRTLNKMSQREVANRLGISKSLIAAYETGERTPSTENLLSISYFYRCTTDYLLGRTTLPQFTLNVEGLTTEQLKIIEYLIRVMKGLSH